MWALYSNCTEEFYKKRYQNGMDNFTLFDSILRCFYRIYDILWDIYRNNIIILSNNLMYRWYKIPIDMKYWYICIFCLIYIWIVQMDSKKYHLQIVLYFYIVFIVFIAIDMMFRQCLSWYIIYYYHFDSKHDVSMT